MLKAVKFFTNSRGMNFLPDFWERIPGGDRVIPAEELTYSATNSYVGFWRFYDPLAIEEQIRTLRQAGINNLRIWTHYYVYENFKTLSEENNPFYNNLKHLLATLEENCMYCLWVFFDGLLLFQPPTPGAEYNDITRWHYYPATGIGLNSSFMDISGAPYISSVCKIVSGSQATLGYELVNETSIEGFMASANFITGINLIRQYDRTPGRKIAPGFGLQPPWDVTGMTGFGELGRKQLIAMQESGANLLTMHPYASLDKARELYVNMALSSGYNLDVPVFFSEGALDNAANSFRDFFDWCETSGLGFSVFQAFASNKYGTTYPGIGLFHADNEIRLSSTVNFLTGMAIRAGYDPRRIRLPNYKTNYSDADSDGRDDFYYPPPNHPLSRNLTDFQKANPKYVLGGLDKDIDQSIPIGILQNWSVCTTPLSSIRGVTGLESAKIQHLLAEQNLQFGAFSIITELQLFTAAYWGVSASPASAFFNQYNMTQGDVDLLNVFIYDLRRKITTCAANYVGIFTPGDCFWGPGCPFGIVTNPSLDCWDWNAYTLWSEAMKTYTCAIAAQMGIFNCN